MYKNKISAVYQIINTVTGDRYVGSSKNVMQRLAGHKCPSMWNERPNSLLYKDMQKYGVDKFRFQILAPVEPEYLKQVEQEFIEMLNPTYNNYRAKDRDIEKRKETSRKCSKKYYHSGKGKKVQKKYKHQLCSYNGETLTLNTLFHRFYIAGIEHPFAEARKYLIGHTL